jgi:hypothetical protein
VKKGFTVFTDGNNLREKKVARGYLRQEEMNQVVMLASTYQLLMGFRSLHGSGDKEPVWEKFEKSGIITKEQIKYIKMATTYQRKFLDSFVGDNLDRKSKEIISKRLAKWELRVADDYQIKRLENLLKRNKEVNLSLDEFYSLVDAKLYAECKGCTKNRNECKLRDFYEAKFIPPIEHWMETGNEEVACNCEYAY